MTMRYPSLLSMFVYRKIEQSLIPHDGIGIRQTFLVTSTRPAPTTPSGFSLSVSGQEPRAVLSRVSQEQVMALHNSSMTMRRWTSEL